ncbi:uncharacterized protein LOC123546003 [Mercenaria mercenaria]|uniref:uncharacterized protein LOC123546003 n=1 Tax=Mercenaria mercenaria TaxID=6596 RepID=UPI00234E5A18|nr:uncharacterized protein LOC123546003 [Mercenaria mercenaria]
MRNKVMNNNMSSPIKPSAKNKTSKSHKGKLKRSRSNKNEAIAHRVLSIKTAHEVTKADSSERNTYADVKRNNALTQGINILRKESPDTVPRCSSADTINTTERQYSGFIKTDKSSGFKSDRRIYVLDKTSKSLESPRRDMPNRHFSAVYGRDKNSRNNSPVARLNIRSNSAVSSGDMEARNNSAVHGPDDTKPGYNSARGDTSRNTFAGYAQSRQSRNYSRIHRVYSGSTASRNNSAVNKPRTTSAVYRTEETRKASGAESPDKIEDEIIIGNRITSPSADTSIIDETHSPIRETQEKQGHVTNGERNIYFGHDSLHSPRCIDRTNLLSRGSSLMLGSGRVTKYNDTETLQLHFDNDDYSNLLDNRMSHVRSVTITTHTINTPNNALKETKLSPRPVEVSLPKTFITKSGSLLLYSDNKVIKDKIRQSQQNSKSDEDNIQVKGRKMSPRTLVPQAYPYWGKHVKKESRKKFPPNSDNRTNTGCTKRDQREYIGIKNQSVNDKPYSWDFAVLPVKLINEEDKSEDKRSIKTVSNLSEAVLAYRSTLPSSQDKYLAMMEQTGDGETKTERMNKFQAMQMQRLSTWTKEWVGRQSSITFNKNTIAGKAVKDDERNSLLIERLRNSLKQSLHCHAPVNTPLVGSDMHF